MKEISLSSIRVFGKLKERFDNIHRLHFTDRRYWRKVFIGLVFLSSALILNFYAGRYTTSSESNSVTDIILSHTKAHDVDGIFTYGAVAFVCYIAFLCLWHPWKAPFTLKSISLFVLVRSVSISLTHLGPFPTHATVSLSDFLQNFIFTGDLFFSWHTWLPFLIALIFWEYKFVRIFCIAISVMFGVVVLLGHLHYSIDVFSAFFITYSVYRMSEIFFAGDWASLQGG